MERDPRERIDDLEELRFGDEAEDEPQPAPDEQTTFDRARFDVFDSDLDSEPDLVFTPEPDATSDPEPPLHFDIEPTPEQSANPGDLVQPDWWIAPADLEPAEGDIPFELLTLEIFDEDEDDMG